MKKALCFLLLTVLVCISAVTQNAQAAGDVPQAVLDLRRSVVRVICQANEGGGTGSGFAIGTEEPVRYIVTNLHVVEDNPGGVSILRENNREIKAKVFLQLEHADLCVLLLDEPLFGVPPVTLQDGKDASVGQAVYALGFPGAADDLSDTATGNPKDVTITDGIVGAIKSLTLTQDGAPINLLQINVAITFGNSGGPLVDEKARVLGINSMGSKASENFNGAIAIKELTKALRERSIVYLSTSDDKAGFPLMTVVIAGASAFAVAATILVILLVRRARKKKKVNQTVPVTAGTPLPEYLKQWGGRLPYGMAVRVLAPAMRELAALHAAGRMHGDVCPETISVDPNSVQATLHAPESSAQGSRLVLRPGFSAPEQYRADGRIGPWSDVYSMSAVLYSFVTGSAPRGAMERMAQSGESIDLAQAGLGEAQAAALFAGLALDAGKRPQNAMELATALGVDLAAAAPVIPAVAGPATGKPAKKRMKAGKKVLIAALATLLVLCAGAGGFYLYQDSKYNAAVECIQKQDYKGGMDNLVSVISGFKYTNEWMIYAFAGYSLQQNDFNSARQGFTRAGNFNNAQDMLKEVDYLEAYYLLASSDYARAKEMFTALGKYKESSQMIYEVDYQKAANLLLSKSYGESILLYKELEKADYKNSSEMIYEVTYIWAVELYNKTNLHESLNKFNLISEYKDSNRYINSVLDELYVIAVNYYRQGNYKAAKNEFEYTSSLYDTKKYMSLIQAHEIDAQYSMSHYIEMKELYNKILSLGQFEDALNLVSSEIFLLYRLEGSWLDNKIENGFYLVHNDSGWLATLIVDGSDPIDFDNITVKDDSIYIGNVRAFSFSIINSGSMKMTMIGYKTVSMSRIV